MLNAVGITGCYCRVYMSSPWRTAFRAHAAFAGARPDTRCAKYGRECSEMGILETAGGDGPDVSQIRGC